MIYQLHPHLPALFPNPEEAEAEGLLAIGGDLSPERLIAAYQQGIFPWYSEGQPILWWSPDPRCVFLPEHFRIPHTVRKELRRARFLLTQDQAFTRVMHACAEVPRSDQGGTWIVPDMLTAYTRLHTLGIAHSIEVWAQESDDLKEEGQAGDPGILVGGLYGVKLGKVFFGESMFHTRSHASKAALVFLMEQLAREDCELVDCQMPTTHIMRYGAELLPRREFLERVRKAMQ